MQFSNSLRQETPALPKGEGAIKGMGEMLTAGGPDGSAGLSIALPASAGRGTAPQLQLTYNSRNGNDVFGMGWSCGTPAITLRTAHGVPQYADEDTFLAPSGEVMVIAPDKQGQPDTRTTSQLQGVSLKESWRVTRYQPRIFEDGTRYELWRPASGDAQQAFWLAWSPDGQVHLFGKSAEARIADPANTGHIARWLLQETVTTTGEHIFYRYRAEDEIGCDEAEKTQHPAATAQRYLVQVNYGNITPRASLFALDDTLPADDQWLFHLVFDFNERAVLINAGLEFSPQRPWAVRPDCFSHYEYGFEIRTRRLCANVLLFHRLQALAGQSVSNEAPVMVGRLMLGYQLDQRVSTLVQVRQASLLPDENPATGFASLPPLEFDYSWPLSSAAAGQWQAMPQLEKFNYQQPWQFADLYGEGIPGIIYQGAPGAWYYRAPQRDPEATDAETITYAPAAPLPRIPSLQAGATLLDINGDGKADWLVTLGGLQGYHSMEPEGQWSPFIPLDALPNEYFHPQSQLADLTGDGLPDLVMIGPRSVRLYTNQQGSWQKAQQIAQQQGITLPVANRNARTLVAFADMLGTGQQQLVEIAVNSVRCWPNLGHGRFGDPVTLNGFNGGKGFNPDRVYLADLDGSGATDIILANSGELQIFRNQSGNRFDTPLSLPLPDGVKFDRTCVLNIADSRGKGVSDIILTVPHMTPQHWRLALEQEKPWLLKTINNNMGAQTSLFYRSSAQFWLDEKQRAADAGRKAVSYLPFPVHVLQRTEVIDEITGNRLSTSQDYAWGAWDGREREFRGFGRVSSLDTNAFAAGSGGSEAPTMPSRTISWFATGIGQVDRQLASEFWQGDSQAWPLFTPRYTRFDNVSDAEQVITPSEDESYWLNRALKGLTLRTESYGLDGSLQETVPYSVEEFRPLARLQPALADHDPCVLTLAVETRHYQYERYAGDPVCNQQTLLQLDRWGQVLDQVDIAFPRRTQPASSYYPDYLPDTLFASSYDDQQQILWLNRQQQRWHQLEDNERFILGLADFSRSDALQFDAAVLPAGGLSLEALQAANSLLNNAATVTYLGHTRVLYTGADDRPDYPPLVACTETAELDTAALSAFEGTFSNDELEALLISAGYLAVTPPLAAAAERPVWVARRDYTDYGGPEQFYRPLAQRPSLLAGNTTYRWDRHYCGVVETIDAAGLSVRAQYDYRLLVPNQVIDINDNYQVASYDALGRPVSTRFWGTENGEISGYTAPDAEQTPFTPPTTVEAALALTSGIPVATLTVYDLLSWMPQVSSATYPQLQEAGVITDDGRLLRLAWQRWQAQHSDSTAPAELSNVRPPHRLDIITDRYDSDPEQQLRQTISLQDGFGRTLQSAIRHEAGPAWQRNDDDGSLVAGSDGAPAEAETLTRWAVSGRTEYDGKGQAVRTYQPYFLNSWEYVSDDSARTDLYADTHFYDPAGREYEVLTAKGYRRRVTVLPWLVATEDENDMQGM